MRSALFIHIAAATLILSGGCAIGPGKERMEAAKQSEATGNSRPYQPSNEVEKIEVPTESASNNNASKPSLDEITSIALNSECAKTAHDVQGKPPKSYLKGSALSFARSVCQPGEETNIIATQAIGDASKDALAHYGVTAPTAKERLEVLYSLMLGSAARESSWRWCVGKDPGASNTSAETCEAGLYQTSWNSRSASPALSRLFQKFKADKSGCFATEYKGATTCSDANMKNYGTGEGVEFQKLSKECPGFATEYHAVMLRLRRSHYGPINIKKSSIKPACTQMFKAIRAKIESKPALCSHFGN